MNKLYIGLNKKIELPKADFIFIADKVPKFPQARIFDPLKHSFNPLKTLDYRKACTIIDIFDALFDRGNSTLTKDTGLDFISDALDTKPRFLADLVPKPAKKATTGHIWAYSKVQRILRSPILKKVLCSDPPNFHFNSKSVIFAQLDRSQIGDFDCLVLGMFLMASFSAQIVVPDGGFYLRDMHICFIREGRLVAGVNHLSELSPKLRSEALLVEEKEAHRAIFEDAVTLAHSAQLIPATNEFNDFLQHAMS